MLTTMVGAGIMELLATMKIFELVLDSLIIIFICVLMDISINILLRFSRACAATSYGEVMRESFGKIRNIPIYVIINNLGILSVYMIIRGVVLSRTSSKGVHHVVIP